MEDTFSDVLEEMEQIGVIYRSIKERYGDTVSITYLDPRNHFAIMLYLFNQWKKRSLRFVPFVKSILFGIRKGAFFYNGYWLNRNMGLDEKGILDAVEAKQNSKE